MRSDHCWSHGRGRPSASFQAGSCTARARRLLRQRDGQHLDEDAIDVVFGLRLGEAEAVDLHAVAEHAVLGVGHAVALERDLVPQLVEGAHLADLGDEPQARIDEERDAADDGAEVMSACTLAGGLHAYRAPRSRSRARYASSCTGVAPASCRWYEQTLVGFHFGTSEYEKTIVSLISRSEGSGGNT